VQSILAPILERLFGWTLNVGYVCLLLVVSPVLLYRSVRHGKYRDGWAEKLLGNLPVLPAPVNNRYWFHAVSVGEVLLLAPILDELLQREPNAEIVITSTTSTGFAIACDKFQNHTRPNILVVSYFPLDFTWAVSRSLRRIQPTHVVLVELELWPNFIVATQRFGALLQLINARLSQKSFRGYSRARWLMQNLLARFDTLSTQDNEYAERLISLGADQTRVVITGSVKFDGINSNRDNPATIALKRDLGIESHHRVFVAGSTQDPEERIAIAAWQVARQVDPNLRLILVPRHKERFEEVAHLVKSLGLELIRRTETAITDTDGNARSVISLDGVINRSNSILLLDTLGELAACWGLADCAFVGGSLTNRGGQNMIEPAGYGAAVCFGPNTRNFRHTVDQLISQEAACVVHDQAELAATLVGWINDPQAASQQGLRAQQFVASQQGASKRTVDAIRKERLSMNLDRLETRVASDSAERVA
jgi:3-deoxy-D-manno-octulosonic-acid transferase